MNAAGYWPTAVFELAHETIHLLDPVVGYANFLEEGIAVAFSVAVSRSMTNHPMEPKNFPVYLEAWGLVREAFGDDLFVAGKEIRVRCGALRRASVEDLVDLFPSVDPECRRKLVAECIPR